MEGWLKAIEKRVGVRFSYAEAEAKYSICLNGTVGEKDKDRYDKGMEQVMKDLDRTFPGQKHFKRSTAGTTGITQLKNLLRAMVKRDLSIGYVQGMNFLMGALLFHSCEVVAFWLFDVLMRYYQLQDVYGARLPGLHLHGQIVDLLLEAKFGTICEKMVSSSPEHIKDRRRADCRRCISARIGSWDSSAPSSILTRW